MHRFIIVLLIALLLVSSVSFAQPPLGEKKPLPKTDRRPINRDWKPMLGAGIGLGVQSEAGLLLDIDGMLPVSLVDGLYVRTSIISLWAGSWTSLEFGTGSSIDFVYFIPQPKFDPYAFGGLHLNAMTGFTTFTMQFGAGAQVSMRNSPLKPYGEIGLGVISQNGTSVSFSMMFGLRFEL